MTSLRDIIDACAQNNSACQKLLYEQFYGYSLKIVFRYVFQYEKAKDVVNDGFVKLFRNIHQFKSREEDNTQQRLMGWLKRIMINAAIDELRRNNMQPDVGTISESAWEMSDNSCASDQQILYKELVLMIKLLPPAYRAVFNLIVIDGLSHDEVSKVLSISVGTSKSNLSRARQLLQKHLKAVEMSVT